MWIDGFYPSVLSNVSPTYNCLKGGSFFIVTSFDVGMSFFLRELQEEVSGSAVAFPGHVNIWHLLIPSFDPLFFWIKDGSWFTKLFCVRSYSEFNKITSGILFVLSMYFLCYSLISFLFLSRIMYIYRLKRCISYRSIYFIISKKYPFFHNAMIVFCNVVLFFLKRYIFLIMERGFLEVFTGYGIALFLKQAMYRYLNIKTGIIYHYAGFFLLVVSIWLLLLF